MWISVGIAVTKIGSIWARSIVVRRVFQTGTSLFILLSVLESRKQREKINEAYKLSIRRGDENFPMAKHESSDVPF